MAIVGNTDGLQTIIAVEDGKLVTGSVQDCDPIAEYAKERHKTGDHGSKDMRLAASLPDVLVEKYCHTNGIDFREFMGNPVHIKRMCNDPALSSFRVWPGRL